MCIVNIINIQNWIKKRARAPNLAYHTENYYDKKNIFWQSWRDHESANRQSIKRNHLTHEQKLFSYTDAKWPNHK